MPNCCWEKEYNDSIEKNIESIFLKKCQERILENRLIINLRLAMMKCANLNIRNIKPLRSGSAQPTDYYFFTNLSAFFFRTENYTLMKSFLLLTCAIFFTFLQSDAQLRLPAILSSGMVLQQQDSVALWGWSEPAQIVKVRCSWNDRTDSVLSSNGALWLLKVRTPAAGGPYTISITTDTTIILSDVLIGEVWVCSGQSNMGMNYMSGEKDVAAALNDPANAGIRLLKIPKTTGSYPQDNVVAQWKHCDSSDLKNFSSVGYFFGKKLHESLKVPVGLIDASWGGTPAEPWTPSEKIRFDSALFAAAAKQTVYPWWPMVPGVAFNGMIAPLTNYRIAGCIWYQGEGNTSTNGTYTKLFTTMIGAWRQYWKKDLPFYYVQIAPYNYETPLDGALLQEAQTRAMEYPNVGMAVIADLIDSVTNIHPTHKKPVGNRLANWALSQTYHQPGIVYRSPQFDSVQIKGPRVVLTFKYAAEGLVSSEKVVTGFYLSDYNNVWYPATAAIQQNKITVSSKKVAHPVFVRYGFSNTLAGNVFSKEGLPLTPFRTDSFKAVY
jgi:sialate O-acetylesterase